MGRKTIDPSIWGPAGWNIVHGLAAKAVLENDATLLSVFQKLYIVLPCPACQKNYQNHILELPVPTDPKKALKWSFDLHHRVNDWRGKKVDIDYASMKRTWMDKDLKWQDVWIFLEAIVEAHPGAFAVTKDYIEQVLFIFAALPRLMKSHEIQRITIQDALYKVSLRNYLRKLKKSVKLRIKLPEFTCSSAVCHI